MVTILSEQAIPEVRMTVDEYLEADLPEGFIYELVDGVIEMTAMPAGEHDQAVACLDRRFVIYQERHPGAIAHVSQRAVVVIPGRARVRHPDLAIYAHWEAKRGTDVWKEFNPFLVVEVVSPGQGQRDRVEKREDYWLAGIDEYWIADPQDRSLTVLRRGVTQWEEEYYDRPDQVYAPARLPGLKIEVGALFQL